MTDVVDAIKVIAVVTRTAAHTLRGAWTYFARKAAIDAVRLGWRRVW